MYFVFVFGCPSVYYYTTIEYATNTSHWKQIRTHILSMGQVLYLFNIFSRHGFYDILLSIIFEIKSRTYYYEAVKKNISLELPSRIFRGRIWFLGIAVGGV